MAVLVVDFFEPVKIQNHQSQLGTITTAAIQFLFEGFSEQPPVVETCQRIRDGIQLQHLELIVFDDDRHTEQSSHGQNIHQRRFQRDRASQMIAQLAPTHQRFVPQLDALSFRKIQVGNDQKIALEKLPARGQIHVFKRVGDQLKIRVFDRQTERGVARAGHTREHT
jgi:hypothetical protein